MAQSYGNSSISTILAATDEILGVDVIRQAYGTSMSRKGPAAPATGATTLLLALDGGAPVAISWTTAANSDVYGAAAKIQEQVRLAGAGNQYTQFIARFDSSLDKLVLESGTTFDSPIPASSRVQVTGGTGAVPLKLGVANSGTESSVAAPYLKYVVRYRFVYGSGSAFGSTPVTVYSTEMVVPTSVAEAVTIANTLASQIKVEGENNGEQVETGDVSQNGPVSL